MPEEKMDPVRAFLGSFWEMRKEQTRLERKIEELESQSESVTAKLSASPGGGSGRSNAVWDALIEARERAEAKLAEALRRSQEIEQFIDRMPTSIYRVILRLRYLERLEWQPIADQLGYERRQITRIHGAALEEAREVWKKEMEATQ
jgi:hypothetical protein